MLLLLIICQQKPAAHSLTPVKVRKLSSRQAEFSKSEPIECWVISFDNKIQ